MSRKVQGVQSGSMSGVLGTLKDFENAVRVDPELAASLGPYLFAELVDLAYDRGFTERLTRKLAVEWNYLSPASPELLAGQFHRVLVAALVAIAEESAAGCAENA